MDTTSMDCITVDWLTMEATMTTKDQTMTDPMRIYWSTTIWTMMDQMMKEVWMSTDPATIEVRITTDPATIEVWMTTDLATIEVWMTRDLATMEVDNRTTKDPTAIDPETI
jgi:hypothetical protein